MVQGGAERQFAYLAIGLTKAGENVRLIKFHPGENAYESDLEKYQISTETASCGPSALKRPIFISKIVKDWKADCVIAYKDGASMAACISKFFTKFRLIVSERNTSQKMSLREKIKFQLYRFADHIVPNSESQKIFIHKNAHWLESRVVVITNMIDTSKFKSHKIESFNDTIPHIMTSARIAPQKNLISYIEAISILKSEKISVHFDWYGRVMDQNYFDLVQRKVNELEVSDYITFHGGVDHIEDTYSKYKYYCLPSLFEGFPNSLCEAMASGLICVASDVCDNKFILCEDHLRFNPNDTQSIAVTIKHMLSISDKNKEKISIENSQTIRNLCSEKVFIKKYMSISK